MCNAQNDLLAGTCLGKYLKGFHNLYKKCFAVVVVAVAVVVVV